MFGLTKKAIMIILAAITLVSISVATTLAILVVKTASLVNQFELGNVSVEITDDNKVLNNSDIDTPVYIRVAVVANYYNKNGNLTGVPATEGDDYSYGDYAADWLRDTTEGYFYHKAPIRKGEESGLLPPTNIVGKPGFELRITYLVTAIQAYPANAVEEAWGVTLDADGNIIAL